jgi:CRP/FNR family transcriptional regulator, cyclic AMP receptor protein
LFDAPADGSAGAQRTKEAAMGLPDVLGYLTAGLILTVFWMKSMIPLRIVAVGSNVAGIAYGVLVGLPPMWVLHGILLPLNVMRLVELRRLAARIREVARGELSVEALLPLTARRSVPRGTTLFNRGDEACELFYVLRGTVRLPEVGRDVQAGELLGEIGLFLPRRERTATAVCETDVELLALPYDRVMQTYYQNPRFGFHLVQLIAHRLTGAARPGAETA